MTLAKQAAANPPMPAVLLLGPTGSGKTPLGDFLESHGLLGGSCAHFDFGRQLRGVSDHGVRIAELSETDALLVKGVVAEGRLLEDHEFRIAEALLTSFITRARGGGADLIILNGLPRHVGQAEAINRMVDLRLVLCLECPESVALGRIVSNSGGDRTERNDDAPDHARRRIRVFEERTAPLAEYYRRQGVATLRVCVDMQSEASRIAGDVETQLKESGIRVITSRKRGGIL